MKEVDIGDPSPAVFTRIEWDGSGKPMAAFVSCHGEAFCLERLEVELRIRYLRANGADHTQESKAVRALRKAFG